MPASKPLQQTAAPRRYLTRPTSRPWWTVTGALVSSWNLFFWQALNVKVAAE